VFNLFEIVVRKMAGPCPAPVFILAGTIVLHGHLKKQAIQRREEALREVDSLMSRSCCTEGAAVAYRGWYDSVHTFEFENERYAQAFIKANRGKAIR
jgi:hypothetical protein